jgi:hypothetical protein
MTLGLISCIICLPILAGVMVVIFTPSWRRWFEDHL